MLDINFIRQNPEAVKKNNKLRGSDVSVDKILELDKTSRELIGKIDIMRAQKNKVSSNKPSAKEIKAMQKLKQKIGQQEKEAKKIKQELRFLLEKLPNLTHRSVPAGKDETENKILKQVGDKPKFDFKPKTHWQLGKELDLIDKEKAAKISGARFAYLKNGLVKMQFAIIQLVLDVLTDEATLKKIIQANQLKVKPTPFAPILPPVFIRPDIMQKMARLEPKEDRYYTAKDDLYLVGSAEHTLGPLHMNQILPAEDLPIRYLGYSTSFRREAGTYGKDTKGIFRLHQFDKLEMESFCQAKDSIEEQNFFIAIQEYLVEKLGLPYQRVAICTGDMGNPDYRQIDIEVWMPGQNKYRETHTSDLMIDYQSRRLGTKTKVNGKLEYVHMNDATAFALGRILIAIMENYQRPDGTIKVPKVLQDYCKFKDLKINA